MPSTTIYKRGERRPALIVSPDSFNTSKEDVVLVAITSQIGTDSHAVLLDEGDFIEGTLPKPSRIRLSKIFTIHSALIVKRICGISKPKLEEVLKAIREFYS
jgi:mRNA interferase MazF